MLRNALCPLARLRQPAGRLTTAAAIILIGATLASAEAPKYTQIRKPNLDATQVADVKSMLTSGTVSNVELLQSYFLAQIADMSAPAKERLMHRIREDIKKDLITAGSAPAPTTHDQANAILVKGLANLIVNSKLNLHPAVRYNCALLLADLDSVEKKGQSNPTPLPPALDKLIAILNNPDVHDSVRLATLVGVTRHATFVDDPANRAKIAKAVIAFLDGLDNPEGPSRKRDVKFWLEARAMEALGATIAPTPEVVAALQARLADENRPLWVRSAAAVALGKLKYESNSPVDAAALVTGYKALLETAVDQGVTRRELREVIFAVKRGIAGESDPAPNALVSLLTDEQKKEGTQMINAMSKMAEACDSDKIKGEARAAMAIQEVVDKWRSGGFSDTLDEDAKKNLTEDESSGDEPPAEEGIEVDFGQ